MEAVFDEVIEQNVAHCVSTNPQEDRGIITA